MRSELQDIVDEVARLLKHPVTLEDRRFNLVAFNAHFAELDDVRESSILHRKSSSQVRRWFEDFGIATSVDPVRTPNSTDPAILGRLCIPVRVRGVTLGYLWLLDPHEEIDQALIPAAQQLATRAGAIMEQQTRSRDDLGVVIQQLLSGNADAVDEAADEIAALELIRRGQPISVVELRAAADETRTLAPVNLWPLPRSVLSYIGEDHTTLVVPLTGGSLESARNVADRVHELFRQHSGGAQELVAGIGSVQSDIGQARKSWQHARLATRVLRAGPQQGHTAAWPDLGIYRLLACGPHSALHDAAVNPAIQQLLDEPDRELRRSAQTYLDLAGNVQLTAEHLNVHRQTVYHRLARIQEVTGLDLTDGQDRLSLHLGLTLAPLLERISTDV